jgi:predicted metal-dependent hydrolase
MHATSGYVDQAGYVQAISEAGLPKDLNWRVTVSPRRRTVGFTAEPDGSLTIRVPQGTPVEGLTRTIARRRSWIARATSRRAEIAAAHASKELIDGENFPFLGRNRQLILAVCDKVQLDGDRLITPAHLTTKDIISWYATMGLDWLNERAPQYCSRVGVALPVLDVRDLGQRWGTCIPGVRPGVVLHWALFQLSPQLIDLVIVHELAHLLHPKHSAEFDRLVEQIIPGYRDRLADLTEQGRRIWMGDVRQVTDQQPGASA